MFGLVRCNASILARQSTDPHLYLARIIVKNWLWPILTFFGVTGNILTIIVLTKRRMIMSSTNNYLVALAIVDALYLILTLMVNTFEHPCLKHTSAAQILLTICRPIGDFASNSSVWLTVTFTVERWVAITYPLQSRTLCTVSRARRFIFGVICVSMICTLPSTFEMKLVSVTEQQTLSNGTIIPIKRIRAEPTALGTSRLYHQIYFNFVTFAIIWIPLLLLLIFNTILIYYVQRSESGTPRMTGEIELRRHNRGNQGEQRKTTIMLSLCLLRIIGRSIDKLFLLVAVVLVFTVCQIPQAISLLLQSHFPIFAQQQKFLVFNNFANCLVAVNASINFLLYCCFSDRFRSTFRSNFTLVTKFCTHYLQTGHSNQFNRMSQSYSMMNQSNYSIRSKQMNHRISNLSHETTCKLLIDSHRSPSFWAPRFSLWSRIRSKKSRRLVRFRRRCLSESSESYLSSPSISMVKRPSTTALEQRKCHSLSSFREPIWIKQNRSRPRKRFSFDEIFDVTV